MTYGLLSLFSNTVTPGSLFNGGKSQIQSDTLLYSRDWPFNNIFRFADQWDKIGGGGVDAAILDANGWPTVAGHKCLAIVPPASSRTGTNAGKYLIKGTITGGDITIGFGFATGATSISGATSTAGALRCLFTSTSDNLDIQITTLSGLIAVPGLCMCHLDDEAAYDAAVAAGETWGGFTAKYKARMIESKAGEVRFMDVQETNTSSVGNWASRKSINYWSFASQEFKQSCWLGSVSGTTDFTLTGNGIGVPASGGPVDGQIIHWKFASGAASFNGPNSAVTLTPGSSNIAYTLGTNTLVAGDLVWFDYVPTDFPPVLGGIQIVRCQPFYVLAGVTSSNLQVATSPGGPALVAGFAGINVRITRPPTFSLNGGPKIPLADSGKGAEYIHLPGPGPVGDGISWTARYDADVNCWVVDWNYGIQNGMPPEICLKLCYQIGAHPYFNIPHGAGNTDYPTQLASYIKTNYQDTIAPWMVPRFEGANECWNPKFLPTKYATWAGPIIWAAWAGPMNGGGTSGSVGINQHCWYNRHLVKFGTAISAVYANDRTKYAILCGVMSATHSGGGTANSNARLNNNFQPGSSRSILVANGTFPTMTMADGRAHGYAIGDPVAFISLSFGGNGWGTDLASPINAFQTYYVCNDANFTTTTFNITTTVGGGVGGRITTSSAGNITFVCVPTADMACKWTTHVCCTNYINPENQDGLIELQAATQVAAFGPSDPTAISLMNYYVKASDVTRAEFTGRIDNGTPGIAGNVLTVAATPSFGTIRTFGGDVLTTVTPGNVALATKVIGAGTGTGGAGTYTISGAPQTAASQAMTTQGDLLLSYLNWQAWGAGMPFPVTKITNYEGGWSPDYKSRDTRIVSDCSYLSYMTKSAPGGKSVVTLTGISNVGDQLGDGTNVSGIAAVAGGWIFLRCGGSMSAFSNTTQQIFSVSGNTVTLNLDTSGATGDYNPGVTTDVNNSITYVLAGTGPNSTTIFSVDLINNVRYQAKFVSNQQQQTFQNYTNLTKWTPGGEFPSCFVLSYFSGNPYGSSTGANIWGNFDPDIWATPSKQWDGIIQFNNTP